MTYNEGWIEVVKGGATAPLDSARRGLPTFGKLQARPAYCDYWVPHVQAWAKARGAPIHYIDNCWLYVAVSAASLVEFLQSIDQPGVAWLASLIARVDAHDSYVIVAEEF